MKIIIVDNYEQASLEAFKVMRGVVVKKPNAVLGLATGSSPVGTGPRLIMIPAPGVPPGQARAAVC